MTTSKDAPPPSDAQRITRGRKPTKARWVAVGWTYSPLAAGYKLSRIARGIELAVVTSDGMTFGAVIGGRLVRIQRSEIAAKQTLLDVATRRGLV